MKTRLGFVSNSSSSNFCIFGCCIDKSEVINIDFLKKLVNKYPQLTDVKQYTHSSYEDQKIIKLFKKIDKLNEEQQEQAIEWFDDNADSIFNLCNINYNSGYEWDQIFFGNEWSTISDNETGAQFKERVRKELEEIFGPDITCDTHSEAWMDG